MFRILLADDDALQLDFRKQLLEAEGYRVEIAFTAPEAMRHMKAAVADLVIMDLRLPNAAGQPDALEGRDLIRRMRDLGCGVPLIVLSGWPEDLYGQPEERLVSQIIPKPVRAGELLDIVRQLLA